MFNSLYERATAAMRQIYDRRIQTPAVLDPQQYFAGAARFGAAWPQLRLEALAIQANLSAVPRFHELMAQQAEISNNDQRDWRMFVIKAYGVVFAANAARCPQLAALVAQCPQVVSASLSFLAPHKYVPQHRGPFRGVIRYYLGLSVPLGADAQPGTTLTIDGRQYRLGNGQALLWDDTFAHDVHNDTDAVRVALLLDVRRTGMPLYMDLLSRLLIALIGLAVRLRRPV
jgi:aspartate beta-hydroxylase